MRLLTAAGMVVGAMAGAGPQRPTTATVRDLGRPPGRSERAIQTWSLASTGEQAEVVIKDLQSALLEDPEQEVRFAAAWALGHLRVKETGEKAHAFDDPPRRTRQTKPIYPPDAYRQRIQGTVVVEFLIDERGHVAHAEVRESIPPLDRAALDTVKQWRFTSARSRGKSVAALGVAPVAFAISR